MATLKTAAPQFLVDDLAHALAFYRERLGFSEDFVYEGFYASVSRDGVPIHLGELKQRGARIAKPLEERPWGVVDFYVEDPDRYILCFAEAVAASPDGSG